MMTAPGARGVIARGLGRSYGDAAQNGRGAVLDCRSLGAPPIELADGIIRVGAGMSLETLLEHIVPRGWMLPVLPATRHVTIGGAIAADVHGKNHRTTGTFGNWLRSFVIVTPSGTIDVDPDSDPELFAATTGGMGLTGTVVAACLRAVPCETSWLMATTTPGRDLDAVMDHMDATSAAYSVAWLDAFSGGTALGRGVVVTAEPALAGDLPADRTDDPRELRWRRSFTIPRKLSVPVATPGLVRPFNRAWFRRGRHASSEPRPLRFDAVLMPLDAIDGWNRLYGRKGFLQYQFAVPDEGAGFIRTTLERLRDRGCWSCFTTLKRFGAGSDAPLSFPIKGWSLSLDIPAGSPNLASVLDELDRDLVEAGGRVYLAKDSRLRPEHLSAMYPDVPRLTEVRARVDPDQVMQSDLARRLGLVQRERGGR